MTNDPSRGHDQTYNVVNPKKRGHHDAEHGHTAYGVPLTSVVESGAGTRSVRELYDPLAEIELDVGDLILNVPAHCVRWLSLAGRLAAP